MMIVSVLLLMDDDDDLVSKIPRTQSKYVSEITVLREIKEPTSSHEHEDTNESCPPA